MCFGRHVVAVYAQPIVVIDDLLGAGLIAQVELVKDYDFFLLSLPDYGIELGVASRVGQPSVPDLQEDINIGRLLLKFFQSLVHVPWEPVYLIRQLG